MGKFFFFSFSFCSETIFSFIVDCSINFYSTVINECKTNLNVTESGLFVYESKSESLKEIAYFTSISLVVGYLPII